MKKMVITANHCLILEYPYTSDYYDMNTDAYKSTRFEPKIKHLVKEKRLDCR